MVAALRTGLLPEDAEGMIDREEAENHSALRDQAGAIWLARGAAAPVGLEPVAGMTPSEGQSSGQPEVPLPRDDPDPIIFSTTIWNLFDDAR